MKSMKQFLHAFGTNNKVVDRDRFAEDHDTQGRTVTLDARPDLLASTTKEGVERSSSPIEKRLPDIRMATNANGKQFPVICNVPTRDTTKSPPTANGNATVSTSGPRTFRRCLTNNNGLTVRPCQEGVPVPVIRPTITLRVSSVPSRPEGVIPAGRCLLPPSTFSRRRLSEEAKPEGKVGSLTNGVARQDHPPPANAVKKGDMAGATENHGPQGDHNTNGLPSSTGQPCTRIPRLVASPTGTQSRTQHSVVLRPLGLRRSTSDISQNSAATNGSLVQRDRTVPTGMRPLKALAKPDDCSSHLQALTADGASRIAEEKLETRKQGVQNTGHRTDASVQINNDESTQPLPRTSGNKCRSKSKCQRRIWSFSLPRFMRSHSSPKLNSDAFPSEEARSSTLPRLRSGEDISPSATNDEGGMFKVTSLTSLHDLPDQAPKTCFSQGDVSTSTDCGASSGSNLKPSTQMQNVVRGAPSEDPQGAKLFAVTGSRSSSDNGTDNGGTERPYIMPPRALRKYIKTNFRRLNVPEGTVTDLEKTQTNAQQQGGSGTSSIASDGATTKTFTDESLPAGPPKSSPDKETARTLLLTEGKKVSHDAVVITKEITGNSLHIAYSSKENTEATQKIMASKREDSPSALDLTVKRKHFSSEETDIHRAIPATISFVDTSDGETQQVEPNLNGTISTNTTSATVQVHENKHVCDVPGGEPPPFDTTESGDRKWGTSANTPDFGNGTTPHNPAKDADVPTDLERQVDGASCSESLSSFESELMLIEREEKRTQPSSRKLKVLDRPTCNITGLTRKQAAGRGGSPGVACAGLSRKGKKHSCERIQQLENEVWFAERELLLLKEKLLRNHGRHSSRPPDKVKSEKEKAAHRKLQGNAKVSTESTEVQCDVGPNPEACKFAVLDETLTNGRGSQPNDTRRIQEENMLQQQELKEKTALLSDLEEELDQRDGGAELESLDRITSLPVSCRTQQQREELRVTKEALTSLRQCFRLDDPYQHTLDTIEQSLCTLLERVTSMERQGVTRDGGRRINFDSTGDPRRLPITTLEEFPLHRFDPLQSLGRTSQPQVSTKVIYYTEKSVTPFLSVIPKRLGDIRLRDFKVAFDRPGQYRFHFKTLDPEFGMVKEEVLHDEDIIPGWDGKIVAWVEEDI